MKKIIVILIVLVVIILGAFYFLNSSKTAQPSTSLTNTQMPTSMNNPTQVPPASTNTTNNSAAPMQQVQTLPTKLAPRKLQTFNISIMNFAFNPNTLNIIKGDTVVWTNNDSVPHQVKGDTLSALSAPVMSNGQTYSFTFNEAGTFTYHCAIHPSMTASITVK